MSTVGQVSLEDAPLFFSPKRKRCAADYLPHTAAQNNNSNNNNAHTHAHTHAETAMKSFHHPTSSSSLLRTAGSTATHTLPYAHTYTHGSACTTDASLCTDDGQSRLCNQSSLSVSLSLSAASLATQPERERERETESETTMAMSLDDSEAAFFSPHVRTQPLHKQAHHRAAELANTSVDSVGAYSGFRPAALFASHSHHTTRAHNKGGHGKAHLRDVVRAKIFDDDDEEDNNNNNNEEQEQRDKHMSEDEYEHEYKHKHTHTHTHTHTLPFTPERALFSQRSPRSPQHGLVGFAEEYAEEEEEPLPAWLQRAEGEEEMGEGDADEHIERLLSQSDSSFDRQLMHVDTSNNNNNSNNNSVCLTHTAHTPVFPHSLSRSHSYTNTHTQCPQTALRSVNRQRSQSEHAQQHHWLTENVSNFTRSCDLSVSQSLTQTHSQTHTPVKKTKPRRASFNTTRTQTHKHTHHHHTNSHTHTRVQALFPNSLPATPVRASMTVGEKEPLLCDLGTPLTERGSPVVLLEGEGLDDDPAENENNTGESMYAMHTPFTPYAPPNAHTQRPVSLLTLGISRASSHEDRERDSFSERESARDSESSCVSLLLSPVRFCEHTHAHAPDSVDKPLAKIRRRSKIFESPGRNNRSSSNNNSNNCSGYCAFAPQQGMNNAFNTALFPDTEREREKERESSFLNSSLSSAASSLSSSSSLLLRPLPDPAAFDHEVTTKLNSSLEHKNSFNGNGVVLGAASPVCPATPSRTPGWKETRRLGRSNSNNNNSSYNTSYSSTGSDGSNDSRSPDENNSSEDVISSFGLSPLPTQSYKHTHAYSHTFTHANSLAPMPRPPLHRHNSLADNKLLVSQCDSPTRSGSISDAVVFHRDFAVEDIIGTGTFAEVYKVRSLSAVSAACPKLFPAQRQREGEAATQSLPVYFAVKKIKRQFRSRKDRDWLLNEVLVMKRVNQTPCPYIIPFVRAWQEDNHFFVQLGLAEKGTLKELEQSFVHRRETMPTNTLWHVVHDVAAGLAHIHACNIVHLDIKPANILIDGNGRLQIGDFGMASELGSKDDSHEGDTRYMAPELLNISERLPSADIFSLALTVYELCYTKEQIERGTLLLPTEGPLWHKLREGDSDPVKHRPAELVALIKHMLQPDPASRPSAAEIVALPQVKAMAEDDDEALTNAQPPVLHRPQANRHSGAFFPILRQPSINEADQAAYMAELYARAITPH